MAFFLIRDIQINYKILSVAKSTNHFIPSKYNYFALFYFFTLKIINI